MVQDNRKIYSRRDWLKAVGAAVAGVTGVHLLNAEATGSVPGVSKTVSVAGGDGKRTVVSRIAKLQEVGCMQCDACMPCGYGVDIPGNFRFYNEMLAAGGVPDLSGSDRSSDEFRVKAKRFLRKYDRVIADSHQSQRCIKCFHCVSECRGRVFIVNELAALTALTDELRDWECREL